MKRAAIVSPIRTPVGKYLGALSDLTAGELGAVMGPGGETDVPGLALHTPDPVVRCLPAGTGLQAVMDLHQQGRLALDGTLKELEA